MGRSGASRREFLRFGLGTVVVTAACDRLQIEADLSGLPDEVPPVTAIEDHYRQQCCGVPEDIDTDGWSLEVLVDGEVRGTITWADLMSLTPRDKEHTLQCIGGTRSRQQISNAIWTGLPFREILQQLGIDFPQQGDATQLVFTALDTYDVSIPFSDMDQQDEDDRYGPLWLVWQINGEPLPPVHGQPARFLTPGRYGTKNPKWPVTIEAINRPDDPHLGYWERRGWNDDASYVVHTYIVSPPDRVSVSQAPLVVTGTAYAGTDPIAAIEYRLNDGPWQPAELTYNGGRDVWTLWRVELSPDTPGELRIQARAITASGATSPDRPETLDRLAGYDGSMAITLDVLA